MPLNLVAKAVSRISGQNTKTSLMLCVSFHPITRVTPTLCYQIEEFLANFDGARQRAEALDSRIVNDALAVSDNYTDLVSLAARQAVAATELTVSKGSDGQWNKSDARMFMKNIGLGR